MAQGKDEVQLPTWERKRLRQLIRADRNSARAITRARILMKIDEGWNAPQAAAALEVPERTALRIRRRYVGKGLDGVLRNRSQAKVTGSWMTGWGLT